MRIRLNLLPVFLLFAFVLFAQAKYNTNPNIIQYSLSSGLPAPNFIDLDCDSIGRIWGLSPEGLFYYDGISWQRIDEFDSKVKNDQLYPDRMFVDKKNRVILYHSQGTRQIYIWDGWTLKSLSFPKVFDFVSGVISDAFGNFWIATKYNGLYKFSENSEKLLRVSDGLLSKRINEIELYQRWLYAGGENGIVRISIESNTVDTLLYEPEKFIQSFEVKDDKEFYYHIQNSIKPSENTLNIGRKILRSKNGEITEIYSSSKPVNDIVLDKSGELLIYLTEREVLKYSPDEDEVIAYYGKYLPSKSVQDILVYNDNSYWIATSEGITVIRNPLFRIFGITSASSMMNKVFSLESGNLYFCDKKGGFYLGKRQTKYRFKFVNLLEQYGIEWDSHFKIKSVVEFDGKLFIAKKWGIIYILDEGGKYWQMGVTDGVPAYCTNLGKMKNGNLLAFGGVFNTSKFIARFGRPYPVSFYNGNRFEEYKIEGINPEKENYFLKEFAIGPGNTLYLFNSVRPKQGIYVIKDRKVESFIPIDQLQTRHIYSIYCDTLNRLYLGVDGGFIIYKDGDIIRRFNAGLLGTGRIYDIFPDDQGYLWGIGKSLVVRYDPDSGEIKRYSFREGLFKTPVSSASGLCDLEGRIWISTESNIFVYDKRISHFKPPFPRPAITDMKVNGIRQENCIRNGVLDLGIKPGAVEISFLAVNLFSPSDIFYRTKLEGLQDDWSEPTTKTSVVYASLPAGDYSFSVMVGLRDNMQTSIMKDIIRFHISQAFWETPIFIGAVFLVGIILVFAAVQIRIKRSKKREEKLNKLVEMRTSQLMESEKKYAQIFNTSSDGLVLIDLNFIIVDYNSRFKEIFGLEGEILNKNLRDIVLPEDEKERVPEVITTETSLSFKKGVFPRLRADGELIYVDIDARPISIAGNDFYLVKYTDVTREKELESEQRAIKQRTALAEKLEAIGQFAAEITHNFRNNLQTIIFNADSLKRLFRSPDRPEPNSDIKTKLDAINIACKDASELINSILMFSKEEAINLVSVSVNQLVRSSLQFIRAIFPYAINIITDLQEGLPNIKADSNQLRQVLLNLSSNARDAMSEKGEIRIQTILVKVSRSDSGVNLPPEPGEYICLSFADTGEGMSEDVKAHIFEPFFTTKELGKGTGLGLSSVYGIVQLHGGFIFCNSEPGKGTEFRIFFPVIEIEEDQVSEIAPIRGGNETILIVDDEKYSRQIARDILERFGYNILESKNGKEALRLVDKNMSIKLILLDLKMPEMGGWDVYEKLNSMGKKIPFLIISGYLKKEDIEKINNTKDLYYLEKPYRTSDLGFKVRSILDRSMNNDNGL